MRLSRRSEQCVRVRVSWVSIMVIEQSGSEHGTQSVTHALVVPSHVLRSWELQASNNQRIWTTLRQHRNDCLLQDLAFSVAGWPIDDAGVPSHCAISPTLSYCTASLTAPCPCLTHLQTCVDTESIARLDISDLLTRYISATHCCNCRLPSDTSESNSLV